MKKEKNELTQSKENEPMSIFTSSVARLTFLSHTLSLSLSLTQLSLSGSA